MPICFGPKIKNKQILIFGLENTGKSSFLYRLKYGEHIHTEQTRGFNQETVLYPWTKKYSFKIAFWDMPGAADLRLVWKSFMTEKIDGLVYMVDIDACWNSAEYLEHCKNALWNALDRNEQMDTCPVLFLLNKIDLVDEIDINFCEWFTKKFDLHQLINRSYLVKPCSVLRNAGIEDGLSWVIETMDDDLACRDKQSKKADCSPLTIDISRRRRHKQHVEEVEKEILVESSETSEEEIIDVEEPEDTPSWVPEIDRKFMEICQQTSLQRFEHQNNRRELLKRDSVQFMHYQNQHNPDRDLMRTLSNDSICRDWMRKYF